MAPYFSTFAGFVPDGNSPFDVEFERLSKMQGWGATMMGQERIKALRSELEEHASLNRIHDRRENWRALCREVGLQGHGSITQCKKVSIDSRTNTGLVGLIKQRVTGIELSPSGRHESHRSSSNWTTTSAIPQPLELDKAH